MTSDVLDLIVDAWRDLADRNVTAGQYVRLVEAAPDPNAATAALCSGINGQIRELREVAGAVGGVLEALSRSDYTPTGDVPPLSVLDMLRLPRAATSGPETDENAETDHEPPEPADPTTWDALFAWLDHPANIPAGISGQAETLRQLDTLEAIATAAGLWEPGELDAAADRYLGERAELFRINGLRPEHLRMFAQRVIMETDRRAREHPHGIAALNRRRNRK